MCFIINVGILFPFMENVPEFLTVSYNNCRDFILIYAKLDFPAALFIKDEL